MNRMNYVKTKLSSFVKKLLISFILILAGLLLVTMFLDYRRKNIIEKRGTGVINDLREHPL